MASKLKNMSRRKIRLGTNKRQRALLQEQCSKGYKQERNIIMIECAMKVTGYRSLNHRAVLDCTVTAFMLTSAVKLTLIYL